MSAVRLVFIFLMSIAFGFPAFATEPKSVYAGTEKPVVGKECGKLIIILQSGKKVSGVLIPEKINHSRFEIVKGRHTPFPNGQVVEVYFALSNYHYRWTPVAKFYLNADPETMKQNDDPTVRQFMKDCNTF